MVRSGKALVMGIMVLVIVATGIFSFSPPRSTSAHGSTFSIDASAAGTYLTNTTRAHGPYTVQGNTILDSSGHPYLFHGIGRDSLEYSCNGDGYFDAQSLAFLGRRGTNSAPGTYWDANTVRLPLSEYFWLNGQVSENCSAAQYQSLVKQTVDTLTEMKLNVILDLQWSDAGGQASGGSAWAMPDNDSVTFWQQVAALYASYSNVLFELFNEPHPSRWACWAAPCTIHNDTSYVNECSCKQTFTYQSVGMQALVTAVRNTGATNLVLVAGMVWGYDLSRIAQYPIVGSNVVYDTHPYPYSNKLPSTWDAAFGTISATYPVISAENGEYDCGTSYMSPLLSYFDAHNISWIGWAWVVIAGAPACGYPQLISDYTGTPVPGMGELIYQHLLSYVTGASVTPTPTP